MGAGGPVLYPRNEPSLFNWNQRGRQFLMYSPAGHQTVRDEFLGEQ